MKVVLCLIGCMVWFGSGLDGSRANHHGGLAGSELPFSPTAPDDTLSYELVIMDPAFESWFGQTHKPKTFYELAYLQKWNEELSMQWNSFGAAPGLRPECIPASYIGYDANAEYGKELEHRLFYFFRYWQERCKLFYSYPGRW